MNLLNYQDGVSALEQGSGEGVKIAILDSGVDTTHPDLAEVNWADQVEITSRGGQVQVNEEVEGDSFGHGTAVAGIIHQLAPQATLGSFRILGARNDSRAMIVREGVKQAVMRGYNILQCSFGTPVSLREALVYKGWVDASYLRGVHIVAAGSNTTFETPEWPAHFPTVISVGASQVAGDAVTKCSGSLVQLAANGVEERALWPGGNYRKLQGSSFAAPKVSAYLARLLSVYPQTSPLLSKEMLLEWAQ